MSDKKKNPLKGIANYFREVRAELKKVVWPTLKQIQNNTLIVIVCIIFVGAIIWALDLGFKVTLGKVVSVAETTQQSEAPQGIPQGNIPMESIPMDNAPQGNVPMDNAIQDGGAAPQQNNEQ